MSSFIGLCFIPLSILTLSVQNSGLLVTSKSMFLYGLVQPVFRKEISCLILTLKSELMTLCGEHKESSTKDDVVDLVALYFGGIHTSL